MNMRDRANLEIHQTRAEISEIGSKNKRTVSSSKRRVELGSERELEIESEVVIESWRFKES